MREMTTQRSVKRIGALVGMIVATSLTAAVAACNEPSGEPGVGEPVVEEFIATAYSLRGRTASGEPTRRGIVAADPRVLPLDSKIRLREAGEYSGTYVVKDTGRKIKGNRIDIYIADRREAREFGRQEVEVEVLSFGEG